MQLAWTTQKPTKPGWYWWRSAPDLDLTLCECYFSEGQLMVAPPDRTEHGDALTGEWSRPLEPTDMTKPMIGRNSTIMFLTLRGGGLAGVVRLSNDPRAHTRDGHSFVPFPFSFDFTERFSRFPRIIVTADDRLLDRLNDSLISATLEWARRETPQETTNVAETCGKRYGDQIRLRVKHDSDLTDPRRNLSNLY